MVRNRDSQEKFKEISISEFFEKNKHILGFDSPQKSMFMVVKEPKRIGSGKHGGIVKSIFMGTITKVPPVFS